MVKESWRKALKTGVIAGLGGFFFARHKGDLRTLAKETAEEIADIVKQARGRKPMWERIEAHYTEEDK